jgi:RNA polymerase sigma factor (sigma-70 family)
MSVEHFDRLVATHHGEIYKYLVLVTGRVSDADDLSQQTFLRAFNARKCLAPEASVRPLLFAIATDLSRSRMRSKSHRRRPRKPIEEDDREVAFRQAQHSVALAITRLPLKQRMAFALRRLHDFNYESIGRMLRCPSQSARAWVVQAFRKVSQKRSPRSGDSSELGDALRASHDAAPPPRG